MNLAMLKQCYLLYGTGTQEVSAPVGVAAVGKGVSSAAIGVGAAAVVEVLHSRY